MNAIYAAAATVYFVAFGLLIFWTGSTLAQFFVLLSFMLAGISQYVVQSDDEKEIMWGRFSALIAIAIGVFALLAWLLS
jgi:hypothetical protein